MSRERICNEQRRLPKELSIRETAEKFTELHIPLATILNERSEIDIAAEEQLSRRASFLARGLFYGGTSGMGGRPIFTPEFTETLVGIGVKVRKEVGRELGNGDDLLIACGAYGPDVKKAAEFARAGVGAGADLVVAPPIFFGYNPDASEIKLPINDENKMHIGTLEYYEKLAQILGDKIAIAAYNIPGACFGKYSMPSELVREILKIPNIIGIKDSSRNGLLTQAYGNIAQEFAEKGEIKRVLSGFFPTIGGLRNADGGVPIEVNDLDLIPLVIWQAKLAGDYETVEKIQKIAQRFLDLIVGGLDQKDFPKLVEGTVYALSLRGIGGGYMPSGQLAIDDPKLQKQIKDAMEGVKDERRVLVAANVPEQFIREAEQIIAGRKAR